MENVMQSKMSSMMNHEKKLTEKYLSPSRSRSIVCLFPQPHQNPYHDHQQLRRRSVARIFLLMSIKKKILK
jgi:hypothetical protein